MHWTGQSTFTIHDETVIYLRRKYNNNREGIGFIPHQWFIQSLVIVNQASKSMMSITLNIQTGKLTVIQLYAPTSLPLEIENFHNDLQVLVDAVPQCDTLVIKGDLNVKVGTDNTNWQKYMGTHDIGSKKPEVTDSSIFALWLQVISNLLIF